MTHALSRFLLALGPAVVLTGCVSVPRDSGFPDVRKTVLEHTRQPVEWDPRKPVETPSTDDAVRELLQEPLTADRAVQIALANNRDLQATFEDLGIARADLIAASTVRNPILDAEIRFPGGPQNPFEIALTQTLIDLIQLPTRRRLGNAMFEAERLRVTGGIVNFAAEVRTDYFELQAAQQVLARQQVIAEAARLSAELAMRQHSAGNISDLDLENEQALYEQAKLDLAHAELSSLAAREHLVTDLGLLGVPAELKLAEDFPPLPQNEPPRQELESEALSRRIDVSAARLELQAAQRQIPIARAAVLDEISGGVHHEREPDGKRTTGPSVAIPIPIFDRGAAQRARAAAVLRQAQQRYAALMVNARSEVRAAQERLIEARSRVEYIRDVVLPRRQRILYLTHLEYNAMIRGVFELIQAKQHEAGAQRAYIEAQRDYWVAHTELEASMSGVSGFSVRDERRGGSTNRQQSKENE